MIGPTSISSYIYDNKDILLELDGSNNILARYTHGPGIDEPLILEKSGQSFFYHADALGSITEITNSSGTVAQSYTYSSFGKIESQLDPNFVQPYMFTSREFDPETGLYHYRKRTLNPNTGRFLQVDPIAFAGGDVNLYVYVGNNPTNHVDPFGLQRQDGDICRIPNANIPKNPEPSKPQPPTPLGLSWLQPTQTQVGSGDTSPTPPSPENCSQYPPGSLLYWVCINGGDNPWANCVRTCLREAYLKCSTYDCVIKDHIRCWTSCP